MTDTTNLPAAAQAADGPAEDPAGEPVDDRSGEPFALTDIQAAYVVGKTQLIELGGQQQYYVELDSVNFDVARAERAMVAVVRRFEQLRTVMSDDGMQRVMPAEKLPDLRIRVEDLTVVARSEQEDAVRRVRERLCERSIDPTGWPLFDVTVSRLRHNRVRVHLRVSLLLLDAPSIRTVIDDWELFYVDPDVELPPIRQTFRQWRTALKDYEQTEEFAAQWRYWEDRLDLLPEAPQLPLAKQPKSIAAVRFEGRTTYLDKEQWQRFCANFRKHRVLPTTAMLHVYAEALGAWAASPHFCLNVVHLNLVTRHPGEDVVGQRTATLPLEVDMRGDAGFWERAQRLQKRLWKDMANSDVTGVRIARELSARNGWSQRAALPYVFTSNQGPGWDTLPSEGGPIFRFLGRIQHTPQVLVDNQLRDTRDGGVASNLDFVDDAFPPGLPDLVAGTYRRLLEALSAPGGAEAEPDLLAADFRALIRADNRAVDDGPAGRLEDGFLRQCGQRPDAPAVVTDGRTLTYAELEARSRAVALWLRERGAGSGDLVPVVMAKGWEQVVAVLGVLRAGAAYCPIEAGTPARRIAELLQDCQARFVLAQSHSTPGEPLGADVDRLDVDTTPPASQAAPEIEGDAADLAYVIFTSGSTGRPKGVAIEHRAALNTVVDINERVGLAPRDRVFAISSLSFDLSVWDVFGPLAAGAAVIIPQASPRPDPLGWAEAAARHGATVWNSVPALAEMLVEVAEQRPDVGVAPLRGFLLSGDWISPALPNRLRRLRPGSRILAMGGATEASIWSNLHEVTEVDPAWRSIPYGRPLRNQTMTVLDERLELRQPWAAGEIYIGGHGVARGYWRDPERTEERFIRHPRTGSRLYRTGDLGRYRPDGTIEFLGRVDRQVKIQGFRIELGEVEAALRAHPAVRECAVCVDGTHSGQRRLVAFAVPEDALWVDDEQLGTHLRALLPHYMVPGLTHVVDRLPLSANGKVDVARALAMVPAPAAAEAAAVGDDELVDRLARIWAEVLELPAVDPDADVFGLGANSLTVLRVVNRLRTEFGVDIPMGQVFETPTVRGLAGRARQAQNRGSCLVRLTEREGTPLFLFHIMGGSIAQYPPLARAWPGPVSAFQSRALLETSDEAFAADLESMAAAYRHELQRAQPQGPYILGGWSMGGTLAYEVARQLADQGHDARLFMIDSDLREMHLPVTEQGRHMAFLTVLAAAPPPAGAAEAVRAAEAGRTAEAARDTAVEHGLLPAEVDLQGYLRLMRIMEHEWALLAAYRPGRLPRPGFLFLAADEPGREDPVPQWRKTCPDLEFESFPCDHYAIAHPDRLAYIAERVARWAGVAAPDPA
ncbi:non-ribosomal peptide synthetase [Catenulispora rubra]|uniref:non-ribosomal peptide synthetase n=1 Tax=Catenulispora rubra TaxID=280293 RepID=UPI0018923BBE|nr:non-ribosomal peptide synthetase [Catenulispora rubra]